MPADTPYLDTLGSLALAHRERMAMLHGHSMYGLNSDLWDKPAPCWAILEHTFYLHLASEIGPYWPSNLMTLWGVPMRLIRAGKGHPCLGEAQAAITNKKPIC